MTALLSFLGSGAFGSIVGAMFAWLNKRAEIVAQKNKFEHDRDMAKLANDQALAVADKARAQTREVGEQAVAGEEAKAFTASQIAANQKPETAWMEVIMGCVRPLITLYLLVLGTLLASEISGLVGGLNAFDQKELFGLYAGVIDQVFFLLNLTISWWFGARGSSPRGVGRGNK